MCDSSMVREYGLLGAFDTITYMLGERIAVITNHTIVQRYEEEEECEMIDPSENLDSNEEESESEENGLIETEGIMYLELQYSSMALATQLHYRFGVQKNDRLLIACEGHTGAEIVAILANMRLGSLFVPIETKSLRTFLRQDQSPLSLQQATREGGGGGGGGDYFANKMKLQRIIELIHPFAVIVVGDNDQDEIVKLLNSFGIFRCVLLDSKGNLIEEDATVTSGLVGTLPDFHPFTRITEDDDMIPEEKMKQGDEDEEEPPSLYILHTSGSTGESKGVIGSYRGLINRITWQYDHFPYEFGEVAVRRTPLTFVDALAEIFCPLLRGIPIVAHLFERINQEGILSVTKEASLLEITRITLIPSQLLLMLKQQTFLGGNSAETTSETLQTIWPQLKTVIISGEECSPSLIDLFSLQLPNCTLINIYGSTEVSGDITAIVLHSPSETQQAQERRTQTIKDGKVSIGQVIDGNIALVVNYDETTESIELVQREGEVGELLIIGCHVANGYFQQSSISTESLLLPQVKNKFIPNPILSPEFYQQYSNYLDPLIHQCPSVLNEKRAFLMGDLVFHQSEGQQYYYYGRKDRQVKIRGNRISLEAIEREVSTLLHIPDAVVALQFTVSDLHHSHQTPLNIESTAYLVLILDTNERGNILQQIFPSFDQSSETAMILELKKYFQQHLSSLFCPDFIFFYTFADYRTSSYKIHRPRLATVVKMQLTHALGVFPSAAEPMEEFTDLAIPSNQQQSNTLQSASLAVTSSFETTQEEIILFILKLIESSLADVRLQIFHDHQSRQLIEPTVPTSASNDHLKIEKIRERSYFELGGNSIGSIELLWKLKQKYPAMAQLGLIHLHYSIEELGHYIYQQLLPLALPSGDVTTSNKINPDMPPSKRLKSNPYNSSLRFSANMQRNILDKLVPFSINAKIQRNTLLFPPPQIVQDNHFTRPAVELTVKWKQKLLKCVDASPIIGLGGSNTATSAASGGIVFIGSHGGDLICCNLETGDIYWKILLFEHIESAAAISVSNQTIIITSFLGNDIDGFQTHETNQDGVVNHMGRVRCLSVENGDILWTVETIGECKQTVTLDESNHRLFSGCYAGIIQQLNISDGINIDTIELEGSIYSSFQISKDHKKLVAATTRGNLYLLNITLGELMSILWQFNYENTPIFSSPNIIEVITNHLLLVVPFVNGEIVCWKLSEPEMNDTLQLLNSDELQNLKPAEGQLIDEVVWQQQYSAGSFFSSMTILSDEGYKDDSKGIAVRGIIGCHDGILRVIDIFTGDLLKQYNLHAVLYASPFIVPIAAGAILIAVATTAGDVIVLKETAVQDNERQDMFSISKIRLPGEIFSSPLFYQNQLYVGCRDDHLYCLHYLD